MYARLMQDVVFFTSSVREYPDMIECPDSTQVGMTYRDGEFLFIRPAPKVSPVEFMLLFTSPERVAIKARRATDPVIDDWLDIVQDPRLTAVDLGLQSTKDALSYLVSLDILTSTRRDEILSGAPQ